MKSKILIVDDNVTNIEVLDELLCDEYTIHKAECGEDAVKIAFDIRPQLILLDIMMPGIDGYETCRLLRENKSLYHTKIIMVSAKTDLEDRMKGYDLGADDYVTKPFDQDELKAKINVYVKLKTVEETDRLKTDLFSLFSNRTQAPLTRIGEIADIIDSNPSLPKSIQLYGKKITHISQNLLEFINKVNLLCQLKNDYKLNLTNQSLQSVIDEAVSNTHEDTITKKNIAIDISVDESIKINTDKTILILAFYYVINNAIKFSPQDGEIKIIGTLEGDNITVQVTDKGPGIPEDLQQLIFEEFEISDEEHRMEGQGLSLALARHIANYHQGNLTVKNNEEGGGACFIFTLKA